MGRLSNSRWISIVAISHVKLDCFLSPRASRAGPASSGGARARREGLVSGRGAGLLLEGWRAGWEGGEGGEVSGTSLDWGRTSPDWESPREGEGRILNRYYLTTRGRENLQIFGQ